MTVFKTRVSRALLMNRAEPVEPVEPVETGVTINPDLTQGQIGIVKTEDERAQEDLEQTNVRREIEKWLLQHFNVTVDNPSKISENV